MDISKKSLIITLIVNLVLLAAGVACLFITKFNIIAISIFVAATIAIAISSVLVWKYGKSFTR